MSDINSSEDIINNASSWNLAKDSALLTYLENISEDLIKKADSTNNKLNDLLSDLNNTHLNFNIAKNRFQSLHNTQFIESRVYEDDETLQTQEITSKDENENFSENNKVETMKNIIQKSVEVVNKYFDKVEIPESDSEDDVDFQRFTLKAKDPYSDRPLPFVIGTDDWHKKWHVGLLDSSSSDSEDDYSEKDSYSDFDYTLPVSRPQVPEELSESSSETDLERSRNSVPPTDISNNDKSSFSAQTAIANNTFAEQLAEKLGNVFNQNVIVEEPVINTRPIQKDSTSNNYKGIFSDEPPPLNDDTDDLFNPKNNDLFDDLDRVSSDDLQTSKKLPDLLEKDNVLSSKPADSFLNSLQTNAEFNKKKLSLFDDDDEEDGDDIFSTNPTVIGQKSFLFPRKNSISFFDDEPPEIKADEIKKPAGGVAVNKNDNLFNENVEKVIKSSKEKLTPNIKQKPNLKTSEPKNSIDIFNDDELFDGDLFSSKTGVFSGVSSISKSSNLFSDSPSPVVPKSPVFPPVIEKANVNIKDEGSKVDSSFSKRGLSLFDDSDDDFESLFSEKQSSVVETNKISKEKQDEELKTTENENNEIINKTPEFSDTLFKKESNEIKSESFFESDDDFLFSKPNNTLVSNPIPDIPKPSLFSSTPPELNDDWDVTSDTNPFDDIFDKVPEFESSKVNLFDDEPPSLIFTKENVSTADKNIPDIVKNTEPSDLTSKENLQDLAKVPGKIKHSLNINVNALLPGFSGSIKSISQSTEENKSVTTESHKIKERQVEKTNESVTPKNNLSLGVTTDQVNVLESITKNRVRAPIQRRPSTRKGRKEHLKSTASDFGLDTPPEPEIIETDPKVQEKASSGNDNKSKLFREKLFDSSDSDSDLFSQLKPKNKDKKDSFLASQVSKSFLNDSDDDDDFFKQLAPKKQTKVDDLFDIDAKNEDTFIFTNKTGSENKMKVSQSTVKKLPTNTSSNKSTVVNDPLNLLGEK